MIVTLNGTTKDLKVGDTIYQAGWDKVNSLTLTSLYYDVLEECSHTKKYEDLRDCEGECGQYFSKIPDGANPEDFVIVIQYNEMGYSMWLSENNIDDLFFDEKSALNRTLKELKEQIKRYETISKEHNDKALECAKRLNELIV